MHTHCYIEKHRYHGVIYVPENIDMNEKSRKAVYKITTWFTMRYILLSENISVFGRMVGRGDNPQYLQLHKSVFMLLYKVHMKLVL
jgi:hypothetical protein